MINNIPLPTSLKIVARLFILCGVTAVISVVSLLAERHVSINFGLLGLFVGAGLLRLNAAWRRVGMGLLILVMALIPIFLLLMLASPGPIHLVVLGRVTREAHWSIPVALATIGFIISAWQYRVLASKEVRKLFYQPNTVEEL